MLLIYMCSQLKATSLTYLISNAVIFLQSFLCSFTDLTPPALAITYCKDQLHQN